MHTKRLWVMLTFLLLTFLIFYCIEQKFQIMYMRFISGSYLQEESMVDPLPSNKPATLLFQSIVKVSDDIVNNATAKTKRSARRQQFRN